MEKEFRFTTGKHRFMHEAQAYLRDAMEQGKQRGFVSKDATVRLVYDEELPEGTARTALYLRGEGKKTRPLYVVSISSKSIGDWDVIRHESGHIFLGHPEKGPTSGIFEQRGDYLNFLRRELRTEYISRRGTQGLPYLHEDIAILVTRGEDFGYSREDSFNVVKDISKELNIPYTYIKQTRKYLQEAGYLE